MKSVILQPTHIKHNASTKKRSSDVLDKENIPPPEDIGYETQPLLIPATKKSKRINSFNKASSKTSKIRKTGMNTNKKKIVKSLQRNNNVDNETKSKKQEEGEERSHNIVSPIITSNIDLISRRLKDNMTKATYNMMACLVLSNQPCDHYLYEKVFKSDTLTYNEKTLSHDESHLEMLVCGSPTENHAINVSSLYQEDDTLNFTPIFNRSFDIDQENEFINAWLQHGSGSSEYSSSCFDPNDSFSIVTEQELSELLLQDSAFL